MSAGRLDQRVTILARDEGITTSGMAVETWMEAGAIWSQVTPLRGGETFTGSQRFADATHRFRIRWREDVDQLQRLRWRGADYNVLEALPAGQRLREWLDVIATASPAENPA